MYLRGDGVKKQPDEAVKWFRMAAEQGNPHAQYELGLCYALGDGISADKPEAYFWFALAAAERQAYAHLELDKLEQELSPAQITAAQKRAAEWQPVLQ